MRRPWSSRRASFPESMRIFGVGFNKTGTTSLHRALLALGFTSLHWGGPPVRYAVEGALAEGRPLLSDIEQVDAYSDIEPLYRNFDIVDRQYPGSRFVLTERDVDEWIDSRRRHVERNRRLRAAGHYHGAFLDIAPDQWRRDFEVHYAWVKQHFAGREELLVLRISDGEGYEQLCPFLGVDVPEHPFPWSNRDQGRS